MMPLSGWEGHELCPLSIPETLGNRGRLWVHACERSVLRRTVMRHDSGKMMQLDYCVLEEARVSPHPPQVGRQRRTGWWVGIGRDQIREKIRGKTNVCLSLVRPHISLLCHLSCLLLPQTYSEDLKLITETHQSPARTCFWIMCESERTPYSPALLWDVNPPILDRVTNLSSRVTQHSIISEHSRRPRFSRKVSTRTIEIIQHAFLLWPLHWPLNDPDHSAVVYFCNVSVLHEYQKILQACLQSLIVYSPWRLIPKTSLALSSSTPHMGENLSIPSTQPLSPLKLVIDSSFFFPELPPLSPPRHPSPSPTPTRPHVL